jgi:hypothetical protein
MATSTTVTCTCGSQGFIVINAATGQPVDLKTFYATRQRASIDPTDLKCHDPMDLSNLLMVCANPQCRRVLQGG